MNSTYHAFIECIEANDTITIYRHIHPDSDALGSQFALKEYILNKYPNKHVYALGNEMAYEDGYFPQGDQCDEATIASSLAIILDCGNAARIDDNRYLKAIDSFKIDHHPNIENYANHEIACSEAGATCEILALIFKNENDVLTTQCANYLYCGLIADTLKFSTRATSKNTLEAATYAASFGIDIANLNQLQYQSSVDEFKLETYIRSKACFVCNNRLAYIVLTKKEYNDFNLTFSQAKDKVYALGNIKDVEIWCLLAEREEENRANIYNGSLRSANLAINEIANKYEGGGHKLASGVKNLTKEKIDKLIEDLESKIKNNC
ncbi:MAG: bifunctional oligoribonuclease/PAP phosphatase NrnA [Erysipelotrichaceae bacterium]